jgi:hypothetical protein
MGTILQETEDDFQQYIEDFDSNRDAEISQAI